MKKPYTGPGRRWHPIDIAYVVTGAICMVIVLVAGYVATIGAL